MKWFILRKICNWIVNPYKPEIINKQNAKEMSITWMGINGIKLANFFVQCWALIYLNIINKEKKKRFHATSVLTSWRLLQRISWNRIIRTKLIRLNIGKKEIIQRYYKYKLWSAKPQGHFNIAEKLCILSGNYNVIGIFNNNTS